MAIEASTFSQPTPAQISPYPAYSYVAPSNIERPANFISDHFVATNAALHGIMANGSVGNKLKATGRGAVEGAVYQKIVRWVDKQFNKLYEKNPALARFNNEHPIVSGIATSAAAIGTGLLGTSLAGRLYNYVVGDRLFHAIDQTGAGRKTNRFLHTPAMKTAGKIAKVGIIVGLPAYLGVLLIKRLIDTVQYKKAYKAEKAQHEDFNTYQLRNLAVEDRLNQFFENHPRQLARLQA